MDAFLHVEGVKAAYKMSVSDPLETRHFSRNQKVHLPRACHIDS